MYFYTHKINKNETQQNILLEMCRHAGLIVRDGESIDGISIQTFFFEKLQALPCNFFIL